MRLRLDVGCGKRKMVGCLGVDLNRNSDADVLADATHLPFKNGCFDYVYSRRCIQVIPDDLKATTEIYRVLKHSGEACLIFASWRGWLYYKLLIRKPYKCFHLYCRAKLMRLLRQAGFRTVNISVVSTKRLLGRDYNVQAWKT